MLHCIRTPLLLVKATQLETGVATFVLRALSEAHR